MLARTLDVLTSVSGLDRIVVISRDLTAHDIARAKDARPLAETGSGLNAAVAEACAWVEAQGATGVVIVPTDLPLLTASDVESMIDLALEPACVILAPDRRDDGTNLLLIKPPRAIPPAFGVASFESHRLRARQAGLPVRVVRSATAALDIDRPDDLNRYHELAALDALLLYE